MINLEALVKNRIALVQLPSRQVQLKAEAGENESASQALYSFMPSSKLVVPGSKEILTGGLIKGCRQKAGWLLLHDYLA
jgi:hypothetical protein